MKYSVCIESVFEELPIYERIEKVHDFRPDALEFWDLSKYDVKQLGPALAKYNYIPLLCCCNDQWAVRTNMPYQVLENKVEETLNTAGEYGCSQVILMAGDVKRGHDTNKVLTVENLKRLSDYLEKKNARVLLEPLNSIYDHKGYALDNAYDGFEIIESVDSPRVKLLFDCYHMQVMQGNLINSICDNFDYIGHVHSAGVPGRHELDQGEVNYPLIIKTLDDRNYQRYFGLEYFPSYDSYQSLKNQFLYVRDQLR